MLHARAAIEAQLRPFDRPPLLLEDRRFLAKDLTTMPSAQNLRAANDAANPNDLAAWWLPFTPNRAFKARPRLISGAKGMHYYTPDGRAIIDGAAGLWCCNAGHNRDEIVAAIQQQAADLDFAPAFQFGHPKAFTLASRIAELAPGDLDQIGRAHVCTPVTRSSRMPSSA